jgi:hypothetical protein
VDQQEVPEQQTRVAAVVARPVIQAHKELPVVQDLLLLNIQALHVFLVAI